MSAYFVKCTGFEKDENGKVTVVHCTYDPETKQGSGFTGRKVKEPFIGYRLLMQLRQKYVSMRTLLMRKRAYTTKMVL